MEINYGKVCTIPAVPGEPALLVADLTFSYPGASRPALERVSVTVNRGEKVALVGPNGAGKSTLIKLVAALEPAPPGTITVYGNPVGECHHKVAYVPQRGDVDWSFPVTVRQVVMMGRYVHIGWLKRPRPVDRTAVEHAMEHLDLLDLADRQIGELSGGQQQRVMLARSLAHQADLLLMDEPLNNLDVATQESIFDVMDHLAEAGQTVIMSTHDLGVLPMHFTRAIFLDREVIADGPVNEVLTARTLLRAYKVHVHDHAGVWDNGLAD
jgi:ABC-type Mn2+/Zn2+ transport system ATPase subunit